MRLEFIDLGRLPYAVALGIQNTAKEEVASTIGRQDRRTRCPVFFVEHDPPVITVSNRPGARRHLTADASTLDRLGIEVCETDRGGDVTYHGPGQLVAYPILDLRGVGIGVTTYMRWLEEVVIRTIRRFGVPGTREGHATGVWVGGGDAGRKICALGIRVSRGVSTHGLALNVRTNLSHFQTIVPCGLTGREVTSLLVELGDARCPSMEEVKTALSEEMRAGVENAADYVDPAGRKSEDNCRGREGAA